MNVDDTEQKSEITHIIHILLLYYTILYYFLCGYQH